MAETIKDIFQMFPRKKYVQATKKKKKKNFDVTNHCQLQDVFKMF